LLSAIYAEGIFVKLTLALSILILLLIFPFSALAKTGVIVVQVVDYEGRPLRDIKIGVMGNGSSQITDDEGRASIELGNQAREGAFVNLQLLSTPAGIGFVMFSPESGRTAIPLFSNEPDNFVKIILVKAGDLLTLNNRYIVQIIALRIGQSNAINTQDQQPAVTTGTIAKQLGLKQVDVEKALANLALEANDSYGRGVSEMAQSNFVGASDEFEKSFQYRMKRKQEDEHRDTSEAYDAAYNFGLASSNAGYFKKAIEGFTAAIQMRPLEPAPQAGLGWALVRNGDAEGGIEQLTSARNKAQTRFGLYGPEVAAYEQDLGAEFIAVGKFQEADLSLRHAEIIADGAFGTESIPASHSMLLRSNLLLAEADQLSGQSTATYEVGPNGIDRLGTRRSFEISDLLLKIHDLDEAGILARKSISIREKSAENSDLGMALAQETLARVLLQQDDPHGTEQCYQAALAIRSSLLKKDTMVTAGWLGQLGLVQAQLNDLESAERTLSEAQRMTLKVSGRRSTQFADLLTRIAALKSAQDKDIEARDLLVESREIIQSLFGPDDRRTRAADDAIERFDASSRVKNTTLARWNHEWPVPKRSFDLNALCPKAPSL
jgi:tetratricopeptide (TPR) repeat protein